MHEKRQQQGVCRQQIVPEFKESCLPQENTTSPKNNNKNWSEENDL